MRLSRPSDSTRVHHSFYSRLMSWTDDQFDRLRDKLTLAKRQGAHLIAAEIRLVLALMAFWRRSTLRTGWSGAPDGPAPSIAETRAQGISHLFVICNNPVCYGHKRRLSLDDLKMPGNVPVPETAVFVDLPNHCRFRCIKCNGRNVTVAADWPKGSGIGRAHTQGAFPAPNGERK